MASNRRKRPKRKNDRSNEQQAKHNCSDCSKKFKSISSLNTHKKSKHEGRCWLCPSCQETFASKYAYIRHTKREHRTKKIDTVASEAQEQQVYMKDDIAEMTEAAKNALIKRLRKKIENKNKIIALLKNAVKKLKKKIAKETVENSNGSDNEGEEESDKSTDNNDDDFMGFDSTENTNENDAILV